MIIMCLDYSLAKTGIAILQTDKDIVIKHTELYVTNKDKPHIERTADTIDHVEKLRKKYKVDLIIKESAIVGRASTSMPIHKAHGALEYYCYDNLLPLDEIHNATIKSWCKNMLLQNNHYTKDSIKQLDKKSVVAKASENYFDEDISTRIYTPRGKLIDDIADAIMIGVVYKHKKM